MHRTAVSLVAVASVLFAAQIAEARGKPQSKLDAAIAMVEAKSYDKAATELERIKDPRAVYWLGRALQGSGKHAAALRTYQRYLKEAGTSDPQRSVDAVGNVQILSMQVGLLTVTAPEGCTISVDDVQIGKAPLAEPYAVDPGSHAVAAKCGEGSPITRSLDVAEEARIPVDLSPAEKPLAEAAPPPANERSAAPPPRSPSNRGTTTTIIGLGVATALAGGAVYFGLQAFKNASDFDDKKKELGVDRDQLETMQKHTRLDAGLATGLGVAALAVAGVTVFVLRPNGKTETRVGVNGQGVTLAGSF